jgi:hypothetical protein
MLAYVMSMKCLGGEIGAALLTFAVGGDEQLTNLARRKSTAAVHALHVWTFGLEPNPHVFKPLWPRRVVLTAPDSSHYTR